MSFDDKSEMYRIYNEAKEKSCLNNPKARKGDPMCWDCLSDEQRDIISRWYYKRLIEIEKRNEETLNLNINASYFSLVPIAFAIILTRFKNFDFGLKAIAYFIVSSFSCWLIMAFAFYISSYFYKHLFYESNLHETRIGRIIYNLLAIIISFFVIFQILSLSNFI